jgi:hypothetical protein
MGIFDKLFNKSKIAGQSGIKINNQKDLEEWLDIIVYWPSLWERIKSGEKVDSNNFSIKDQLKALINAGEVIGFLNGEKEKDQLSENGRFVAAGLSDLFIATESLQNLVEKTEKTIVGPQKILLGVLLILRDKTPTSSMSPKINNLESAKQRLLSCKT